MIKTGLVSVTFRKLTPKEIVNLVKEAGLDGIEWGGDIHVPHGDVKTAREVLRMTEESGLKVAAYGSYYRVGESNPVEFEQILETAKELSTPAIRVWAGKRGSAQADEEYWHKAVQESMRIAEMASKENIKVAFEFHGNTLTDTTESAVKLLREINHVNMRSYWQPPVGMDMESCLEGLRTVLPWLENLHVFHWKNGERFPLGDGMKEWESYFETAAKAEGDRYAMIEFVKDDEPQQFLKDAYALKNLLENKSSK